MVPLIGFIDSVYHYKGRQLNQFHQKLTRQNLEFVSFTCPYAQSKCIRWARLGVVKIIELVMICYELGVIKTHRTPSAHSNYIRLTRWGIAKIIVW